jgi:hypothetical protein
MIQDVIMRDIGAGGIVPLSHLSTDFSAFAFVRVDENHGTGTSWRRRRRGRDIPIRQNQPHHEEEPPTLSASSAIAPPTDRQMSFHH